MDDGAAEQPARPPVAHLPTATRTITEEDQPGMVAFGTREGGAEPRLIVTYR
ncbi:hypothetical protein OHA72_29725 [Dactylosporangium sp. NBC_01737]|uniref:hypothetical protein n=1 Tax=Dactylosporangium sp. NBC_01737 TaxID=2975959 RepID=UPI002E10CEC1|nr:hypothetical protein OHA72_29725 [Dactylosporangium sp. NBC_01737]